MQPPSARTVGIVVAATIVLTAFHFTDNIVNVDTYPRQDWLSGGAIQIAALLFWPAMAAVGVAAYINYKRDRFPLANWLLVAFSYLGLVSLGHFTAGSPDEAHHPGPDLGDDRRRRGLHRARDCAVVDARPPAGFADGHHRDRLAGVA